MTAAAVDYRLTRAARPADLSGLAAAWRMEAIDLSLPAMAAFAHTGRLGSKMRGALGAILLASASDAVRNRRPCDRAHTSTAEIFFGRRPLIRLGDDDSAISAPFVFHARPDPDGSLKVRMTLFGEACERRAAIADALCVGLAEKLNWQALARAPALFCPPRITIADVRLGPLNTPGLCAPPPALSMTFLGRIDGRGTNALCPRHIMAKLVRRIALLAPWSGVCLRDAYPGLVDMARKADIRAESESAAPAAHQGHRAENPVVTAQRLHFHAPSQALAFMLRLGAHTHIGRGASLGLGRYRLDDLHF